MSDAAPAYDDDQDPFAEPVLFDPAAPVIPGPQPLALSDFGEQFVRLVLNVDRITSAVNRTIGDELSLGPIGAGPGRRIAKVTVKGTYGRAYGHELDDALGYLINLPVKATFDLDLTVDTMRFEADILLPLRLTIDLVQPLTILMHIAAPAEDEVVMSVQGQNARSAVLQRVIGLDGELRRFVVRFVERELTKPHVRKALRIELADVIGNAWEHLARQFLPNSPADRRGDPA